MSNEINFELKNKLRELKHHQIPLDTELVWNDIAARLDEKKRKKRLFIWPFLGTSLMCGLLFSILFMNDPEGREIVQLPQNYANQYPTQDSELIESSEISRAFLFHEKVDAESEILFTHQSISVAVPKGNHYSQTESKGLKTETPILSKNSIQHSEEMLISEGKEASSLNIHEADFFTVENNTNTEIAQIGSFGSLMDESTAEITINETTEEQNENDLTNSENVDRNISGMPYLELVSPTLIGEQNTGFMAIKPARKHFKLPVFIGLQFGIGKPNTVYSTPSSAEHMDYALLRMETERPLESFHVSAHLGKYLNRNFYLKSGLSFMQINEEFSINTQWEDIIDAGEGTISIYENHLGENNTTQGEIRERVRTSITKRKYNHFRSWSIPVLMGYERSWKKLAFNAEIGAHFQFNSFYKGEITTPHGRVDEISKLIEVNQTMIWLEHGIGISGNFGSRNRLGLRCAYRYNLHALNHKEANMQQSFSDLHAGLFYWIYL
jgi:hypothetical protein